MAHKVTRIIKHEEYCELATGGAINDIALFKVSNWLVVEVESVLSNNTDYSLFHSIRDLTKRVQDPTFGCQFPVPIFQSCLSYVSFVLRFL